MQLLKPEEENDENDNKRQKLSKFVSKIVKSISRLPQFHLLKQFCVYQGGFQGNQLEPFQLAMQYMNHLSAFEIRISYVTVQVTNYHILHI